MGHTRLGELPKGQKWKAVVAAMARRDDSPDDLLTDDVNPRRIRIFRADTKTINHVSELCALKH